MGLICLGICACTMPRIIELKDPLSAQEHNDLGVTYEHEGRLDLAGKEYEAAVQKCVDWAVPHFNLGNLHARLGEAKKAEKSYRNALALDSGNPDILNNLAWLLYQQGKLSEARELIEKALAVSRKKEYLDTYDEILKKSESPADQDKNVRVVP